ncbi:uncharacterized protein [Choristoneura fumiferana]|uniref:uncharacterized protein n=1 Tax=Choristoneura fumiferana TaxID=7141 RepID=UPI003D154FF1
MAPTSAVRVLERNIVFRIRSTRFTPNILRSIALWQTFNLVFCNSTCATPQALYLLVNRNFTIFQDLALTVAINGNLCYERCVVVFPSSPRNLNLLQGKGVNTKLSHSLRIT